MIEAHEALPDVVEATRYEILRHAEDLFGHYGFSKTNMSDIAGRCGMSAGNLYRYYRNKQAIGVAVIEAVLQQMEAEMDAALTGLEGREARIRAILRSGTQCIVEEMNRNPRLMEMVDFMTNEDEPYAVLYAHIARKRDRLMHEIDQGIAEGVFADVPSYETAVNLMHGTKAFQMPQSLHAWKDRSTILPELDGVLDLIFMGLRKR